MIRSYDVRYLCFKKILINITLVLRQLLTVSLGGHKNSLIKRVMYINDINTIFYSHFTINACKLWENERYIMRMEMMSKYQNYHQLGLASVP